MGRRSFPFLAFLALFALASCSDEPAAATKKDSGVHDSGESIVLDSGAHDDAAAPDAVDMPDALEAPDTGEPPDTGVPPDTGAPDATEPPDTGAPPDTGISDSGTGADASLPIPDSDGDGISDANEGNSLVDTDHDGIPDSMDPDSDNDGIPDSTEAGDTDPATPPVDTDHDGIPDFRDTDSDGDGIPDSVEGTADTDGDGTPNYLDTDSDGDGIPDAVEGNVDSDNDGIPNYLDPDSDNDGIPDSVEVGPSPSRPLDSDNDGIPNYLDPDSDNDTILDAIEGNVDSDGDGIPNYLDLDSDNDSILDIVEAGDGDLLTPPVDSDLDGVADYLDTDSDNDTISDLDERNLDSDNDGLANRIDLDSDNDGIPDAIEAGDNQLATAPFDTDRDGVPDFLDLDADGDGLPDSAEHGCPLSTSAANADSDNDGFIDPAELAYGSNPCDPLSGINDFYFVLPPNGPGASAPLVFSDTNVDKADFAINIDTTGSMQGEIDNLRTTLSNTIIPGVRSVIPDSAFSVSSFDDFPVSPFGDPAYSDVPFLLSSRVTTDAPTAQTAVNGLVTHNGIDFPEAGLESIYQVTTGLGVTYPGGSVPPFNPSTGLVPGIADGTIGGVGFRGNALPIIVHITDAISHTRRDYQATSASINAASVNDVKSALNTIGARVVTISSGLTPFDDLLCRGEISTFFGAIGTGDVDWFQLVGANSGDSVTAEALPQAFGSPLDSMVAIANATGIIAQNDDIAYPNTDSRITATLTGAGPYYVAITSYGDSSFSGSGGVTSGFYLANITVAGNAFYPSPSACRLEDGNNRAGATQVVTGASVTIPPDVRSCVADCDSILGGYSPLFEDFTFPVELSEETNAQIPACAWSEFGTGRPASCPVDQCCTGLNGAGVPPNALNLCPLAFTIDGTGVGLDAAMITGVQALVNFSTFTVTTHVRPDPVELAASGIDTTCFIHGVIPQSATPPNSCAPVPNAVDLVPPSPELDSYDNVVPGTVLTFTVNALNQSTSTLMPCAPATSSPRLFRAYIDVVADGVTVLDTRDVIIIVPPVVMGGGS